MYQAKETRYDKMVYNRCGNSGLKLPEVSLGFWHNFGDTGVYENMRQMVFTAFDNGITHFDLANNYGPEYGSAEANVGKLLKENFRPYRDELDHQYQSRLRYVERSLWRLGQSQISVGKSGSESAETGT